METLKHHNCACNDHILCSCCATVYIGGMRCCGVQVCTTPNFSQWFCRPVLKKCRTHGRHSPGTPIPKKCP